MRYIIILFSFLCLFGCIGYHHHKVLNVGSQMLYGVEIECNDRSFGHGYLSPGAHKSYSGSFKISKGDKITVIWGLDETSRYHKDLYLKKSPFLKEVVFLMDGRDVTIDYELDPLLRR